MAASRLLENALLGLALASVSAWRKVKEINNLADMLTKQYPTYKFKARMIQVQECGQLMMG